MRYLLTSIALFFAFSILNGQTHINTKQYVDSAYCAIINDTLAMKLFGWGVWSFVSGAEDHYGYYITNKEIVFSDIDADSAIAIPFFAIYNQVKNHLKIELNYDGDYEKHDEKGILEKRDAKTANVLVKLDNDTIYFAHSNYDTFEKFVSSIVERKLQVRLYSNDYKNCIKKEKVFREELRQMLLKGSVKRDWLPNVVPLVYTPECGLQIASKKHRGTQYIMHDKITELCEHYSRLYNIHKIILFSLRN